MAIVHKMEHPGKNHNSDATSSGKAFMFLGSMYTAATFISIPFFFADMLLGEHWEQRIMQNEIWLHVCGFAKWWNNILLFFITRPIVYFKDHYWNGVSSDKLGEMIPQLAELLFVGLVAIGIAFIVILFGIFLRKIGKKLLATDGVIEGGIQGEKAALNLLEHLPDDTHIFANLEFEKRGHHETDIIVVAPAGVTVCEVKYWNGRVVYDNKDWRNVTRIDKRGVVTKMHSPVHQVIAHYETLRDALRDQGINANPRGMVLMMHPDGIIEGFDDCRVPVLDRPSIDDVEEYLGNAHLSEDQINQTVRALEKIAV